ncbi:MAG TPA: cupin domain-containing protein [Fimbriimonadaceae bacterium]|jgi:1,2-dihydroxy-3-keto-5-methylthiopentene dioxygenase
MAVVRIPDQDRVLTDFQEAQQFLKSINIDYEIWKSEKPLPADATSEEVLEAYSSEIEKLKVEGGYVTADVININPDTPNLDTMLNKFNKEHAHDEDEVRFCIEGSGVFHIHPENGPITAIEVGSGDLIRVPRGTHHWFDLCSTRRIKCIRLFQEMAGWTPLYTGTGAEEGYMPVCMGPAFIK